MSEKQNKLLQGALKIQQAFDLTDHIYNVLLRIGLPVARINGRIYGHYDTIDLWLQQLTSGGEYKDVPGNTIEDG